MNLIRRTSAELKLDVSNWMWIAAMAAVTFPSRVPPRGGLFGTRLGRIPITVKLRNGYRLRCRLDELEGYYAAFVHREYDGAVDDWSAVRTVVDGGANAGAASLWFATVAPTATILAVEPNLSSFRRLQQTIARSGLSRRVIPVAAALGASAGLTSVVDQSWSVTATTVDGIGTGHTVIGRLGLKDISDAYFPEHLDVLKLDCEGAEYAALLGAPPDVLQRIGAIVAECHAVPGHDPSELARHLTSLGFIVGVGAKESQDGLLVARRPMDVRVGA